MSANWYSFMYLNQIIEHDDLLLNNCFCVSAWWPDAKWQNCWRRWWCFQHLFQWNWCGKARPSCYLCWSWAHCYWWSQDWSIPPAFPPRATHQWKGRCCQQLCPWPLYQWISELSLKFWFWFSNQIFILGYFFAYNFVLLFFYQLGKRLLISAWIVSES